MDRDCLKCGHKNTNATGDDLEACPACGAIYSRVQASWSGKKTDVRKKGPQRVESRAAFLDVLRQGTAYPVYRSWTRLGFIVMMVFAAIVTLMGVIGFFTRGFLPGLFMVLGGVFIAVLAKLFSEFSLMFADMSDAAICTAYQTQTTTENVEA
ncbi:MAG: hypothetical protein E6Q31_08795 [Aquabacterium sp.]|nr:MAG: hypothetical protein E6Q31_08795 [Aquabacterium sp.]